MTIYVDSFDTLDLSKWYITVGGGPLNYYKAENSLLKFISCASYIPGEGDIVMRTASPMSTVNNALSLEVDFKPHSYGVVSLSLSPYKYARQPLFSPNVDTIFVFHADEYLEGYHGTGLMIIRNGLKVATISRPLDWNIHHFKLRLENRDGVLYGFCNDELLAGFKTDYNVCYAYIGIMPFLDGGDVCRAVEGYIDNFTIENFEASQVHPQLASLRPSLENLSYATLNLSVVASIYGLMRGLARELTG